MTEQGKREKAIEELAQFMCEIKDKMTCEECKGEPNVQCGAWNEATRLYDAGYRKVDEVRKQTATKFLFEAKRIIDEYAENSVYGIMFAEAYCRLLKTAVEQFGVEVEE